MKRKEARGNAKQRTHRNRSQTQVQQTSCSQSTASFHPTWIQLFFYLQTTISVVSKLKEIFTFTTVARQWWKTVLKQWDWDDLAWLSNKHIAMLRYTHTHQHWPHLTAFPEESNSLAREESWVATNRPPSSEWNLPATSPGTCQESWEGWYWYADYEYNQGVGFV